MASRRNICSLVLAALLLVGCAGQRVLDAANALAISYQVNQEAQRALIVAHIRTAGFVMVTNSAKAIHSR